MPITPQTLSKSTTTPWVFNEDGASNDFRVEGDTDENLLFVDGSTDRVGIGTNNPSALLHVDGATKTTSATVDNGLTVTAGGITVTAGGQTITAGGQTITAGGQTITAGGQTITAGDVKFRGGNSPINKATVTTEATAGAVTYTIAQLYGGLILRDPAGAGRSDVTPTAALMVAGVSGVAAEDTFEFTLVNTADAAETITLTAGSGVTLVPASVTIAQNEICRALVRFVNVTSSSEAVTIYATSVGA